MFIPLNPYDFIYYIISNQNIAVKHDELINPDLLAIRLIQKNIHRIFNFSECFIKTILVK